MSTIPSEPITLYSETQINAYFAEILERIFAATDRAAEFENCLQEVAAVTHKNGTGLSYVVDRVQHIAVGTGLDQKPGQDWVQAQMARAFAARRASGVGAPARTNGHSGAKGVWQAAPETPRTVNLVRGDTIKPEAIDWLWNFWLARRKLHLIAGAPGAGKTTLALSFASTITSAGVWPDGSRCQKKGRVVVWSGEDTIADTLLPRLMLMGADMSLVEFVRDVGEGDKKCSFDPSVDVEPLRDAIRIKGGADFLIVDPIVMAVRGDSHKNAETRRGLMPLFNLANELGAALLGVTHFSKGTSGRDPVERLTGSLAFGAFGRVAFAAAKTQTGERVFCRAKSNIGPEGGGFHYELHQSDCAPGILASGVHWKASIEGTAKQILDEAEAVESDGNAKGDAEDWLRSFLADGPKPMREVEVGARANGLAWATVRRAQKAVGIKPFKGGLKEGWLWRLPQDAHWGRRCS